MDAYAQTDGAPRANRTEIHKGHSNLSMAAELPVADSSKSAACDSASNSGVTDAHDAQKAVDSYFHQEASFWEEIYRGTGVFHLIHQERLAVILDLERKFARPGANRALDIGCGAGLASIALARRGYAVHAVDSVLEMVQMTRKGVAREGLESRVKCARGDVYHLAYADDSFDLLVAAGVLPWLQCGEAALKEMVRVVKPGGRLIFTTDNRWGLCWFLDPITNPILRPLKDWIRTAVGRFRPTAPRARVRMTSVRECHRMLEVCGLRLLEETTLGFGPLSLFRRHLLPRAAGLRLHRMLQSLADRGIPVLRLAGVQYIAAAEKSGPV